MTDKQVIHFFHGNAVKLEFPHHKDWFIPKLIRHLNMVLAAVDEHTSGIILKTHLDDILEIDISDGDLKHTTIMLYENYESKFDEFIVDFVQKINTLLIRHFNGYAIVPLRINTTSDESLYFSFASRLELLSGITGYSLSGDIQYYLDLLPEEAKEIPQIPLPLSLDQLNLKYRSDLYDGRHYLPVYPDSDFPKWLQEELENVLDINPENTIQLKIDSQIDPVSQKVAVVLISGQFQTTEHLDRLNFYELGLMFNKLLKDKDKRYCLLADDQENYIYAYCDSTEFELLCKYDYVETHYQHIFNND